MFFFSFSFFLEQFGYLAALYIKKSLSVVLISHPYLLPNPFAYVWQHACAKFPYLINKESIIGTHETPKPSLGYAFFRPFLLKQNKIVVGYPYRWIGLRMTKIVWISDIKKVTLTENMVDPVSLLLTLMHFIV